MRRIQCQLRSQLRQRLVVLCGALLVLLASWGAVLAQPVPPAVDLTLGSSTQGRPVTAVRVGNGPRKVVLVGATHGFPERNTFVLVSQLVDYFRARPEAVPPGISLYLLPLLNPDGLELRTRFNARGVDLNRNMDTSADGCPQNDWQPVVAGAYGLTAETGGPYSDSEVESRLIRDFLLDADAVVFYHSNAGVVFPACEHPPSAQLAQVYADGAGYVYTPQWEPYVITGGMSDWAGGLGITAIIPELVTGDQPEFEQNLGGVQALLGAIEALVPPPQPRQQGGIEVQPMIWRAWQAWGGLELFGQPVGPAVQTAGSWSQLFERARLEYDPARTDTSASVQSALLGRELFGPLVNEPEAPAPDARFFPETQHNVRQPFADFWQINGGLPVFGLPLAAEQQTLDAGGTPVVQQVFERAVLQRPVAATAVFEVTLLPLGRIAWAQADARSVTTAVQAR